jgi:hypothetical protein
MSANVTVPFSKYPHGGRHLLGPVKGGNCRRGYGLDFFRLTGIRACAYCGADLTSSYSAWLTMALDHAVPWRFGKELKVPEEWLDDFSNRLLACGACNGFANSTSPRFGLGAQGIPRNSSHFATKSFAIERLAS